MVEQVYSREAREQKFHYSIVERLINLYDKYNNVLCSPFKVFFTINYRNHKEIIRFIAKVFYAKEESLTSESDQRDVANLVPMAFFTCFGKEQQENRSSSIFNQAEVDELVEQVNFMYENWPKEWNERKASDILMTTPYTDQVSINL